MLTEQFLFWSIHLADRCSLRPAHACYIMDTNNFVTTSYSLYPLSRLRNMMAILLAAVLPARTAVTQELMEYNQNSWLCQVWWLSCSCACLSSLLCFTFVCGSDPCEGKDLWSKISPLSCWNRRCLLIEEAINNNPSFLNTPPNQKVRNTWNRVTREVRQKNKLLYWLLRR